MSRNLHKFYYKCYFSDIKWENKGNYVDTIKARNKILTESGLLPDINELFDGPRPYVETLQLEVLYPGLVTGIGIEHEVSIEGEFKLGMHFDWTYGVPVIYGSSVKGVLRNYFKDFYNETDNHPSAEKAEQDIFEGGGKSVYNRDIFFDAIIVSTDKKGRILCSDSITPHRDNPLKNPIPITFMKIAPGCKLEFRFKLVDTIVKEGDRDLIMTKEEKLDLFKTILTTVGIGAKTNVGYGQLK